MQELSRVANDILESARHRITMSQRQLDSHNNNKYEKRRLSVQVVKQRWANCSILPELYLDCRHQWKQRELMKELLKQQQGVRHLSCEQNLGRL